MFPSKKGQSAIEFLTTYGWAILLFIIIIGAMIYFEAFDFSKFIQPECDFGPQMECSDWAIGSDGSVLLRLRNNFGEPIVITNGYSLSHQIVNCNNFSLSSGLDGLFNCNVTPTFFGGEKEKFNFVIEFHQDNPGSQRHNVSGSLIGTVCEGGMVGPDVIAGC